jgi:hypothetical protein
MTNVNLSIWMIIESIWLRNECVDDGSAGLVYTRERRLFETSPVDRFLGGSSIL